MSTHHSIFLILQSFLLFNILKLQSSVSSLPQNGINSLIDVSNSCKIDFNDAFPNDFVFGAATAAFQIEGGWNEGGRGLSVWDKGIQDFPNKVKDKANAEIACDSYHKYEEDVNALKSVGFNSYRLSISWSRIMSSGSPSSLNREGIAYYHRVLNLLIINGIEPVVTMHHYDTPQALQDLGGLANPIFSDYFEDYANILFQEYGGKVRKWLTFNEPVEVCTSGYGTGIVPPFVYGHGVGEYLCTHHVLISHARAYRLYNKKYRKTQNGKVGITLNSRFYYPKDGVDVDNAERAIQYRLGWFAHPIFSAEGGYHPLLVEEIARNSLAEGRTKSRLPEMSAEVKNLIQGSADFFAFNYYTSSLVELDPSLNTSEGWRKDLGLHLSFDPSWKVAKSSWLHFVPQGLRDILKWIKNEYNHPEIWITENGWSDEGEIEDTGRINYLRAHLQEVLKAKKCDNVNVTSMFIWSIMDNFEWLAGFTERFGLYKVNFTSPNRERTPKASSKFMKQVIRTKQIPETCMVTDKLKN